MSDRMRRTVIFRYQEDLDAMMARRARDVAAARLVDPSFVPDPETPSVVDPARVPDGCRAVVMMHGRVVQSVPERTGPFKFGGRKEGEAQ